MKYTVIDVGANTIRMNIYLVDDEGAVRSVLSKKVVAGLATYVEDGRMTQKGADKLVRVLQSFIAICGALNLGQMVIFATASLRNTENSAEVLDYVESRVGREICLISGPDEAHYGFLGLSEDYDVKDGYIVDIGGGSTEITVIQDRGIIYATSLSFGSLSLYKQYCAEIFPGHQAALKMGNYVRKQLQKAKIPQLKNATTLYGLGGSMRAAGNLSQELFGLPLNTQFSSKQAQKLCASILNTKPKAIRTLLQVAPERVHTITPGLLILQEILRYTGCQEIRISDKGIREGILKNTLLAQI
ncbi:MAG: rod shape-determining protein [Eubacteriales bacterium]|nr:rod shape-determining protein [Eubacteriales bacterium]